MIKLAELQKYAAYIEENMLDLPQIRGLIIEYLTKTPILRISVMNDIEKALLVPGSYCI